MCEKEGNKREKDALSYALKLLAFRNRSTTELLNRLQLKGFSLFESENTICLLKEQAYVDDIGFTKSWLQERIKNKPMGRKRLLYELDQKGIPPDLRQKEVKAILPGNSELRIALQLAKKRWEKLPMDCPHKRIIRIARLLARRGFSSGIIRQVCIKLYSGWDEIQGID
ncbi:MAG: regulatory protein RecX [Bacillota bacterium]